MTQINVDNISNGAGTGAPTFPNGARVSSITDAAGGNTTTVNGVRVAYMGAPDAILEDQQPSGTAGQALTLNTWVTRRFNTKTRDIYSAITLASNLFTPSVNGWVEWMALHRDNATTTRLWNVTDNVLVSMGQAQPVSSGGTTMNACGGGPVVAGKTYRIEQYGSGQTVGAVSLGTEVYSRLFFWRT